MHDGLMSESNNSRIEAKAVACVRPRCPLGSQPWRNQDAPGAGP